MDIKQQDSSKKPFQVPPTALPFELIADGTPQECLQRLEVDLPQYLPTPPDLISTLDPIVHEEGRWRFHLELPGRPFLNALFSHRWTVDGLMEGRTEVSTNIYGYIQNRHLLVYSKLDIPLLIVIVLVAVFRDAQAFVCLGPLLLSRWVNRVYKRHTERQIARAIVRALIPLR